MIIKLNYYLLYIKMGNKKSHIKNPPDIPKTPDVLDVTVHYY